MTQQQSAPLQVHGVELDAQTRCAHWQGRNDILAIKFRCCREYYACYECHAALAGHPAQPWPAIEFYTLATRCGACATELSIHQYLQCQAVCPNCQAAFNPRCALHHSLYFETLA